jgi:hypothetical protein
MYERVLSELFLASSTSLLHVSSQTVPRGRGQADSWDAEFHPTRSEAKSWDQILSRGGVAKDVGACGWDCNTLCVANEI